MPIDPSGPPRRSLAGAVVSTVPLVLLPFAVNVASDSLPGGAQRWAWLSWPVIIVLVAVSWRLGGAPSAPPPAPDSTADRPPWPPPADDRPPRADPWPPRTDAWPPRAGDWFPGPDGSPRAAGSPPRPADPSPRTAGWAQGPAPSARPAPYRPAPPRPRPSSRPWRILAVPVAASFTGVLLSQFDVIGVHAPFLAAMLILLIAVVLCFAEVITPRRVPRGVAAGLLYALLAGAAVWRWDSSRADLWYVAESSAILGAGIYLASRVRDPRTSRRVLPGVVLALLGWAAMGVLFAIYHQKNSDTAVANTAFFACLSTVVAGTIATGLQTAADRDPPLRP
ncbi:hypothetical protein [Actinoplanes sp. RD1]|uniref:hypothetical protein n=1 Tax=Actinoplanes sp. RD1 TaxID=3064538 RepID=UPI0027407500|nr:hypothetical protein [Actinoplanes sp. RD1]